VTTAPETAVAAGVDLTPYVPRVVVDWLRADPRATWRELDGTLAFVDLSGFTAMSERLARLGKAGAEEVTEVMNATFGPLLEIAYGNGGGLLKFGGDALLVFFSGDEHVARAARSAFGMRRKLREIGRPQTSAGTVSLRMHVGVHTGRFQFFLVGGSHRELLITGPGVTQTVAMESAAEAGEILLSNAAAAALPSGALGEERGEGRLLKRDPAVAAARLEPLPDTRGLDLAGCVPVAVRAHVSAGAVEPEHRQTTVSFLRFAGTDRMLAEQGPADVAGALDRLLRSVQEAAEEHGVAFLETDIDRDGGRIILAAGAPQTAGNDEERMLRTLRTVADADDGLQVRAGVHRGRVFAGEVGAPFRRTYTILGETAAVAARLMAKADAGQVLAMGDVLERSRTEFETVELEPFRVKGKTEPLVAYDVRAVAGVREAPTDRRLPFVGRERELAILAAAVAPVRMGFGSLVELTGEPGMGKSRLIEELTAQSADMATTSAACEQYELSTPYFAFRGLLRSLLDVTVDGDPARTTERLRDKVGPLAPDLLPWIPLLAIPLDVEVRPTREVDELQPAFRRARLHGVVEELLAALLPDPTLMVFEDVHWMDEASGDLLRHLGGQVSRRPWLMCATRRPVDSGFSAAEGVPPIPAMTISLEPLTQEAAAALVGAAGNGLPEHELAAITERAGGNPLFLQELLASERGEEVEEALPETVESVVATRIDKLDPGDRALLRYAAVMGATFSGDLIAEVLADDPSASGDSEAWDRIAEFVERDPYTPGAFRFRHALFRDAAYEGLSYRRRRELHARVGEAYEGRDPDQLGDHAELLSLHFFHAQEWEKAYRYSLHAGERAQAKYALIEAASFYRRTLETTRHLPDLDDVTIASIWEALGDVSELAGQYAEAAKAYTNARKLIAKGGPDEPMLLLKEGIIRERAGRYAEALRWYNRGLKGAAAITAEAAHRHVTLELTLAYAGVRFRQGNFSDCITWCRKAVQQADAAADLPALAHAYYLLHLAFTSLGRPEKEAFRGLALPIYEELGDLLGQANVLNNLGIDAYYDGRWDEALDLYRRSKGLRERIGDVVGAATITNNIGEIKADQGHLDVANELFQEAFEVLDRAGHRQMRNLALSNLGRSAARAGDFAEARQTLQKALDGFHEIRAISFVVETTAKLAECAVLAGDSSEALQHADEALRTVEEPSASAIVRAMAHRIRAYALMQSGEREAAEQAVEESIAIAREGRADFELAQSLEARARFRSEASDPEADEIFERLDVVSRPGVPLPVA
jgi:class 3 adenylate cyclase/tetratricopeptide (TPR) repeat protein